MSSARKNGLFPTVTCYLPFREVTLKICCVCFFFLNNSCFPVSIVCFLSSHVSPDDTIVRNIFILFSLCSVIITTVTNLNIRTPEKCCNHPKIQIKWLYHRVMRQISKGCRVYSGSTLFAGLSFRNLRIITVLHDSVKHEL